MKNKLNDFISNVKKSLSNFKKKEEILEFKRKTIGKNGEFRIFVNNSLNELNKQISDFGSVINESKKELFAIFEKYLNDIDDFAEEIDTTIPGRDSKIGRLHPITIIIKKISDFFKEFGFEVIDIDEVDDVKYNFDLLLVNEDHPSRSKIDTFYFDARKILRPHTSNSQTRIFEKTDKPISFISFGKTYRRDEEDATHTPMFHQIEIVCLEKKSSLGKLKFLIQEMVKYIFDNRKIRMRNSFFPFTEPSMEIDIVCPVCKKGCQTCKNTGWIELLGCGMIHKNIIENFPKIAKMEGFAAGIGIERLLLNEFSMNDIRDFYRNDLHILKQLS